MKLKKVLAIALAATTALSSGTAYNLLGGVASAEAASYKPAKDDTFTVDVKDTYDGDEQVAYTLTYTYNADAKQVTSGNTVKLSAVNVQSDYLDWVRDREGNDAGIYIAVPELVTDKTATYHDNTLDVDRYYVADVTKVELDGDDLSDKTDIEGIVVEDPSNITDFVVTDMENKDFAIYTGDPDSYSYNWENLEDGTTSGSFTKIATLNLSGSNVGITTAKTIYEVTSGASTYLETLKIANLGRGNDTGDSRQKNYEIDLTKYTKLTDVDVHGNARAKSVAIAPNFSNYKATTLNIYDMENLTSLYAAVQGINEDNYLSGNQTMFQGIKFITTDTTDASRTLDLSGYSMDSVTVNFANLEEFVAPSGATDSANQVINVDNNYISNINVGGASGSLVSLSAKNNRIMDIDLSGQSDLRELRLAHNYLTNLDISDCKAGLSGQVAVDNYITSDGFTKDGQSATKGTQMDLKTFFSVLGDGGMAGGSQTKAFVKNGGSANVLVAIGLVGAPVGFAERLANTIEWTDANTNGGAVTLGTAGTLLVSEEYMAGVLGYADSIVAYVPVTGAASKTAGEQVTVKFGGDSEKINLATDDVAVLSYDVTTNIAADTAKEKLASNIAAAMFDYPQTAAVLSNGTARISTSKNDPGKYLGNAMYQMIDDKNPAAAKTMNVGTLNAGYKFENFNVAQDGSGDSYKTNKSVTLTGDMTLYATYSENTYGVKFNANGGKGKTEALAKISYNTSTPLTANNSTYTFKSGDTEYTNDFVFWQGDNVKSQTAYTDGQAVTGISLDLVDTCYKATKTNASATLKAMWNSGKNYMNPKESSITLVVGDQDKYMFRLDDLYGDDCVTDEDGNSMKVAIGNIEVYSSDRDVVEVDKAGKQNVGLSNMIYAKKAGNATIYLVDTVGGTIGSVAVTVQTEAEANEKATELAAQKSIDAGTTTDVANYSTYISQVKKNADGENTVTIVEGKNKKTVKINTITIGDKTYTVTRIGTGAYKGASKLTTLTLSNKVKVIGKTAFANCKKLSKVTLGTGVVKILAKAFANDKKLKTFVNKSKKLTNNTRVAKTAFKNAGKSVKTTVKIKGTTKKVFTKEKKAFKTAGLKTYGKKTTTYKKVK